MAYNFVMPGGPQPQYSIVKQMVPGSHIQAQQIPQQLRQPNEFGPAPIPFHHQVQNQYQQPFPFLQYQPHVQQIQPVLQENFEPQRLPPPPQPATQQQSTSLQDFNQSVVRKAIEVLCQNRKPMTLSDLSQSIAVHLIKLSEKQLQDILDMYPNNFNFYKKEGSEDLVVSVHTKLGLCKEHCSKQGQCPGIPVCDGLHICKFYLLSNSCRMAKQNKTCLFGHDMTSPHNMSLLRQNMLEHLSVNDIKSLFRTTESRGRTTMPSICKFYNINVGCRAEAEGKQCPYLHICKFYVIGQCRFGKRCKRGHDVFDPQIKEILTKYGINTQRTPKEILQEIRNAEIEIDVGDDVSSQASGTAGDPYRQLDSDDEEIVDSDASNSSSEATNIEICIFHLRGRCAFGRSCRKLHRSMTYQWQYRKKGLVNWDDFQQTHNQEVEVNFCDVTKNECFVETGSGILKLNFDLMDGVMVENGRIVLQMSIRRLSTASSEIEKFQPLATVWKWFWQNEDGRWWEYGCQTTGYQATVDSSSMEQNFIENPTGQLRFSTLGNEYVMNFEEMFQQNLHYGTRKLVRRRPVFVDLKEMENNKKKSPEAGSQPGKAVSAVTGPALIYPLQSYIPEDWEIQQKRMAGQQHITDHFQRSVITGGNNPKTAEEVQKIKDLFYQTMPNTTYITCIERVENGELWMNFVSKKEKMKRKRRTGDVNEKRLFHGTTNKYIDAICRQGFDFRFSGRTTGNKFGKGSYFTKSAKFADSYTDRSRDKEMFLVRVLAGDITTGQSFMVRPPPKHPNNPFELFDSCVDDVANPNIFVIFTFDQVYPEYVIKYRS